MRGRFAALEMWTGSKNVVLRGFLSGWIPGPHPYSCRNATIGRAWPAFGGNAIHAICTEATFLPLFWGVRPRIRFGADTCGAQYAFLQSFAVPVSARHSQRYPSEEQQKLWACKALYFSVSDDCRFQHGTMFNKGALDLGR